MRYVDREFLQEAQKAFNTHKDLMPLRVGVVTHECVEVGVKYLERYLLTACNCMICLYHFALKVKL